MAIALNTIVLAAIALIVLLVVIGIFTGLIGNVGEKFNDRIESTNNDEGFWANLGGCNPGDPVKCVGSFEYECKDGKMVKKEGSQC